MHRISYGHTIVVLNCSQDIEYCIFMLTTDIFGWET